MIRIGTRGTALALLVGGFLVLCLAISTPVNTASADTAPLQLEPYPAPEVGAAELLEPARPNFENHGAFEAFVDGIVGGYMKRDRIAGVAVSVVANGELLLAKGYGISALEPRRDVDPAETLFRIGSVSKTFTWTAIMQLVESGKISLDDPINDHLPTALQIPDQGFTEPIRVRHLMTHTPGFEDTALGHLATNDVKAVLPLSLYLTRYRPARVREAGETTSYSNHGAALAGAIVATVSGQAFEDYVEQHILAPLGMSRTTFREPLSEAAADGLPKPMPGDLASDVSDGFVWSQGKWVAREFEFISQMGPAGAASATAVDMARFMLAHLQDGRLDEARILEALTARAMHKRLFSNADQVNGLAHGFIEDVLPGGFRSYGHGGATLYFMSSMVIIPELDLGIFISTNTAAGRRLALDFPGHFVRRFFPDDSTPSPEPPADFARRGQRFAGAYLTNRRAYGLLEKFLVIPGGFTNVSVTKDGYLLRAVGGKSTRYVEIAPLTFREVGGLDTIGFREDEDGDITHLLPHSGITAEEKIGFFEGPGWLGLIFLLTLITSVDSVIGWWRRRRLETEESREERLCGHLIGGLGVSWLVFTATMGGATVQLAALGDDALFAYPTALLILSLWVALICALGTIAALTTLKPVWQDRNWPLPRRIRHSLAVAISFGFVLTLYGWNVIGFRYF
ncbi:MAG: serine hydrolase domain-containing protein [Sphingomonadales bacterium]